MIRCIVLLALIYGVAYGAKDYSVQIMQVSKSGKTIFLNRGSYDEIKRGDYALLVHKNIVGPKKFVFKPVAKLKLLKLYDNRSIWVAYDVFIPKFLQRNESLLLFSESDMLKGRKNLDIKRTSFVTRRDVRSEVRDFMLEGDNLAKKDKPYMVVGKGHKAEKHYDADVELIDVEKWDKKLGDDKLFVQGIYKSPHAKEFSQRRRVQSFEKMARAFLNKFNAPGFKYDEFYKEQQRDSVGYMSGRPIQETVTDDDIRDKETQKRKDEELIASLKQGGQGWSKVYSDDELRRLLNKFSVAKEKQRRKGLVSQKFDFQIFVGSGINFVNNENREDAETSQESRFDVEASIEGYILQEFEDFETITFELSGRRALDGYAGESLNVKSTEFSVAAHLNWYPFFNPNVIDQHIVFFGVHYRYGTAALTNETSDESGNYTLSTFPGFRIGIKYNFENTFGYRIIGGFENINVERITDAGTSGNLPDRANYTEGKMSFSLSKFF